MPYKSMYRCTCCSGSYYTDPDGVCEFASNTPRQTIPVSHFGDIENAKIWLILTNPKGDRGDGNVGHLVTNYNLTGRENLTDEHVSVIFQHFSEYFKLPGVHHFFDLYMNLLDRLVVGNQSCTFQNGGICAVDLIKCPTVKDWQQIVRRNEGKQVWYNCLGKVRNHGPNHFILQQLETHKPAILIFAQSTIGLIGVEYKGNVNGSLQGIASMKLYMRVQSTKRLSIDLGSNAQLMNYLGRYGNNIQRLHDTIQQAISNLF